MSILIIFFYKTWLISIVSKPIKVVAVDIVVVVFVKKIHFQKTLGKKVISNKILKIRLVINLITLMQSMSSKSLSLMVVVVKSMMVVVKEKISHPIRSRLI